LNEPTQAAIDGTAEILRLVGSLGPADLCICLVSGGGSALLVKPIEGISLSVKIELTREIAARGGSIDQLNAVRRELSQVKGGGLARACRAGRLVSLILSDVPGDDLATIASGPTVRCRPEPARAIEVIEQFKLETIPAGRTAIEVLRRLEKENARPSEPTCRVTNILLGNNATAVDAAGIEAERLGYSHAMISAAKSEGAAEKVGRWFVDLGRSMQTTGEPNCLISGGETTVELAPPSERGLGGRNQQVALAALAAGGDWQGMALVSGGTDGEDGPSDAAGAFVDAQVVRRARELGLAPEEFLHCNDAYHFFEQSEGLLKTGPTHTNVSDLRVLTIVGSGQ
jgi:hydroxypyruvate reductase